MKYTKCELLAERMYRKRNNPLDFRERMPQQQKFHDDPNKVKIVFGGNRSGKSDEGGAHVVERCLERKSRWWASGITFKDSINVQQRKINSFLPRGSRLSGSYNVKTGFGGQSVLIKAKDGVSKVDFKSTVPGADKYMGDDCDGIWLDEEHDKAIIDECKMRLIDRDGELIITMTSLKGMTPFILEFWEDCEIVETRYAPYLDEMIPVVAKKNGVSFYFLWTTDNKYIDQARLAKEIAGMSRNEIKSRIYGIPINLVGVIYPQYSKKVHCVDRCNVPKGKYSIYTVLDPHDRKPWAIGWFIVHKTGSVIMVDEFPRKKFSEYYEHHTYEEYRDMIVETEEVLCDEYRQPCISGRFIDPNFGSKTIQNANRHGGTSSTTPKQTLAGLGLEFKDSVDGIAVGHMAVQRALSWQEKNGQIVKAPGFYVCNNCINTLEALSHYACGDNGKPLETYKDFCFVGETPIRTIRGQVPIKDIKVGELVATDIGYKKVLASQATGTGRPTIKITFSDSRELIGTPNHNIYLANGLKKRLDMLRYSDIVSIWEGEKHTTGKSETVDTLKSGLGSYIESCGKNTTEQSQKGMSSTTRTETSSITRLIILKSCLLENIDSYMGLLTNIKPSLNRNSKKEQHIKTRCQHGTRAKKEDDGIQIYKKKYGKEKNFTRNKVSNVGKNMLQKLYRKLSSVQTTASQPIEEPKDMTTKQESVKYVPQNTPSINIERQKHAQENVVSVSSIEPYKPETVYNITVEDRHRYYANDILVANCDLVRYLLIMEPEFVDEMEIIRQLNKEANEAGRVY